MSRTISVCFQQYHAPFRTKRTKRIIPRLLSAWNFPFPHHPLIARMAVRKFFKIHSFFLRIIL
jgi:hypothetical protein